MKWLLLMFIFMTSLLFFFYLLQTVLWSEKRVEKRMKYYLSNHHKKHLDRKNFDFLIKLRVVNLKLRKSIRLKHQNRSLDQRIQAAGLPLRPGEFMMMRWFAMAFSAASLYLITGLWLFLIVGAMLGYFAPGWWEFGHCTTDNTANHS